jgi:hypothetical protein
MITIHSTLSKKLEKFTVKNLGKFGFLLLIVLSLFLPVGCANGMLGVYSYTHYPPVNPDNTKVLPVYLDKDFGEADRLEIADAIDQWNFAMNGNAKMVIVDKEFDMQLDIIQNVIRTDGFLILKISSSNPLTQAADDMAGHGKWALAFVPYIGNHYVYLIRDRIHDNDDIHYLVMHEIGHALGAVHDQSGGLMFPMFNRLDFQCVDQHTAMQVAHYQRWDVNSMNYCTPGSDKQTVRQPLTEEQQRLYPSVD